VSDSLDGLRFRFDRDFAIEAWLRLYHDAAYNRDWTVRNAETMRAHAYLIVTAWVLRRSSGRADAMIGTLTVLSDGLNYALIEDVVVHLDYRRRGIGSALVRYALDRLPGVPRGHIQLHAVPGSEPFYERLGFVASGGTLMHQSRRPTGR
jgi:GNAT superfamily N-acetyltransferase